MFYWLFDHEKAIALEMSEMTSTEKVKFDLFILES